MNNNENLDTELFQLFLKYYERITEKARRNQGFKFGQNNYHLFSKEEKEGIKFFNFMSKIFDLNSDLEKTHVFTRRFPIKEYYEKHDIDQLSFIKYHYEVFIHKIHTLLEVKKLWLNSFYNIGLKEEDCNWKNLKKYSKIQESPAKIICSIWSKRNLNSIMSIN